MKATPAALRYFVKGDTPTFVDFYCGIGGSSSGLVEAGLTGLLAANHSKNAIENHSANHPEIEHYLGDIQALDMRALPYAWVLWASPICTEISPAGGRKRRRRPAEGSLIELDGAVRTEDFERTRVTFWEVLRAVEAQEFPVVLIENVAEAADWELFDLWNQCMEKLGFEGRWISVSAAHIWDEDAERPNAPAPQWRDRIYGVFVRKGIPMPDVEPRPLSWCSECATDVHAVQSWKRLHHGRQIGKYGKQYVYVCPEGHGQLEPYVAPASEAVDWTDLGIRIGDRESLGMRQLGAKTIKRIELGAATVGLPALVAGGGNTWDAAAGAQNAYVRAWPLDGSPTPAQVTAIQNGIALSGNFVTSLNHGEQGIGRNFDPATRPLPTNSTKMGEAIVRVPGKPYITMLRGTNRAKGIGEPLDAFAGSRHHGLTIPGAFISKHHGGYAEGDPSMNTGVERPMPTLTARGSRSLVIPYRKGAKPYPVEMDALSTMATHDQHAVLTAMVDAFDVNDCYFRMLKPREAANAQRFSADYRLIGTKGQQQLGAGNAVAVNVAHWLGKRVLAVLAPRMADA
ncbi:DNA cytosine methyltransferase [Nocardioides sp. SR21]|uniref:DNA cytosine methyltransferase n=1 Tax=Nocardioides sp. SR21 TaxID=2919501 RepID=UPI001FA9C220|nr:DNA cytosine methyltransferase [Nocardioides sp. SR21]